MTMQILVPLDGSLFSEQALPCAYDIARRTGAELHLVKVHVSPNVQRLGDGTFISGQQLEEEVREEERRYLAGVAHLARLQTNTEPVTALLGGSIVRALDEYAHAGDIGLVIMTTHGRGGLSRAWLGSVADGLVRSLRMPVLLLRPRSAERVIETAAFAFDHVLIPVDGSKLSECMIRPALALGRLFNARFTLARVVAPPVSEIDVDEVRRAAAVELETLANTLRLDGDSVNTWVSIRQEPALGIIDLAKALGVNAIAIATHGRAGLKRMVLGSVADKVVRGSTIPLLVWAPQHNGDITETVHLAAAS